MHSNFIEYCLILLSCRQCLRVARFFFVVLFYFKQQLKYKVHTLKYFEILLKFFEYTENASGLLFEFCGTCSCSSIWYWDIIFELQKEIIKRIWYIIYLYIIFVFCAVVLCSCYLIIDGLKFACLSHQHKKDKNIFYSHLLWLNKIKTLNVELSKWNKKESNKVSSKINKLLHLFMYIYANMRLVTLWVCEGEIVLQNWQNDLKKQFYTLRRTFQAPTTN